MVSLVIPFFVIANVIVFIITMLRNMGALDVNKVVHRHQGWRLITCMWLHGGIFHLLANMFGLLVIGIRLEKEFGFVLFFDLLGGMLSELLTNWSLYEKKLGALFIAINLAVGVLPHVDNFAHIGGFLSGFLVGFVFLIRPQFGWIKQRNAPQPHSPTLIKSKFNKYQCISWILALILLIFGWNCNPKASSSVVVSICAEISSSELPVSKELGVKKKQCSS
uniref:RHOMBOID-like protein n=1 Tax=Glycine max TaxID=3847 RepID=A0A0R0J2T3_SOYBN